MAMTPRLAHFRSALRGAHRVLVSDDARGRRRIAWRAATGALVLAILATSTRGAGVPHTRDRSAALAADLTASGLACSEDDIAWLDGARGVRGAMLGGAKALVRASAHGEPADLYLVDARLAPNGRLLDVGDEWNVTRTTGVDEGHPIAHGRVVAYATSVDGIATGVHTIDLTGKSPAEYADFTRLQRWQTTITNLQQTGQARGVDHDAYALDPVATKVDLAWRSDGLLDVRADGRVIVIDALKEEVVEGAGWVRAAPDQKARPGSLVTWAVDRVRGIDWFGEENMQYVKAIAFTGLDWILRTKTRLFGDDSAKEVAEDIGSLDNGQAHEAFTDPEIGWPPPAMKPMVTPPLPREGEWIALDNDPFITPNPGAPAAFVTSFVRADKARPQTRVYVTLWDPRQIALHMQAGTVEPVSASGEAGPGVIPRAPEVIRRVVAGFNGGFQAIHGEYGMQADGVLYLPPKPYAATVLEMRDGSTAFGSWPEKSDVPDEVLSYRQNLTALVEHGEFNPWKREWWGGTPKGWKDNIHTTRSGICLTKENFVGYFYGVDISADILANAMLVARCSYGVHLDMNPGLAGFEFYDVQPAATWKPLGRKLQEDWEFEGPIKEIPEFDFRARRMIKGMRHMNFPQYIQRDGRDFFYLTQRPVLPGETLAIGPAAHEAGEGEWRVKGLPQHGFPYAIAVASLRPDADHPDIKVRALRVDPRTVVPAGSQGTTEETPTIVSFVAPRAAKSPLRAWFASGVFLVGAQSPAADATTLADGVPLPSPASSAARAAVGVQDEDGMLDWVELAPDVTPSATTAKALDSLLAKAGCSSRMLVTGDPHALLGGTLDLAAQPFDATLGATAARLVRGAAPGAHIAFESTPIVAPEVWQKLQSQRVRYFRRPPKKAATPNNVIPAWALAPPTSTALQAPTTPTDDPTPAPTAPTPPTATPNAPASATPTPAPPPRATPTAAPTQAPPPLGTPHKAPPAHPSPRAAPATPH
jgi:hypothetical protein